MRKKHKPNKRAEITYDYMFKYVFGNEQTKKYTAKLIELITNIKVDKIELASNVELKQTRKNEKVSILDVKAKINDGIIVNIEMQNKNEWNMQERTERYGAKIYCNEINKGKKYKDIKQVILINILNYKLNKHKEFLSKSISVIDKHRETEIKTNLKYYFLELPKVKGNNLNLDDELTQWAIYMRGRDMEVIKMIKKRNRDIRKIDKKIRNEKRKEERLRMEELRFKWEYDWQYTKAKAEEKGEKRGKRIGKEEGIKEGIKEIAINMIKNGFKKDDIVIATGLANNELEELYNCV